MLAAPFFQLTAIFRRHELVIMAEYHRIAAAFKSGEVVQRNCRGLLYMNDTAILPMPLSALRAKCRRERLPVN